MQKELPSHFPVNNLWQIIGRKPNFPYLISGHYLSELKKIVSSLSSCMSSFVECYYQCTNVSSHLHLPQQLKGAVNSAKERPYEPPILRIDFYIDENENKIKILEINTSDPSGLTWHDSLMLACLENPRLQLEFESSKLIWFPLVKNHVKYMLNAYQNFCQFRNKPVKSSPKIAFVIDKNCMVYHDFFHLYLKYWEFGYQAQILSPQEFDRFVSENQFVPDVVITDALSDFYGLGDKAFVSESALASLESGTYLVLNPFHATLTDQKTFFSFLSDLNWRHLFPSEHLNRLTPYIPWTRNVEATQSYEFKGKLYNSGEELLRAQKDKLVLKPRRVS